MGSLYLFRLVHITELKLWDIVINKKKLIWRAYNAIITRLSKINQSQFVLGGFGNNISVKSLNSNH